MNKRTAEIALDAAYKASYILQDSIDALIGALSDDDLRKYKRSVGTVLAEIAEQLIDPALSAYPTLEPKSEEDWKGLRERLFHQ